MKPFLLLLALLSSTWARAQTCPLPQFQALHQQQPVVLAGSPLVSSITLTLTKAPSCRAPLTYHFREAQLTLVRDKRPVLPILSVTTAEVDLTSFQQVYRPGDRLYIELLGVTVTSALGKPAPYAVEPDRFIGGNWILQ